MLEVKDATIRIGVTTLVTGFSLLARDGEVTCITGPEGSGKTTLLRTLMGFLPLAEGFVSVDGELLTVRSAHAFRQMMIYLPQQSRALRNQFREPEAPVSTPDDYAVWGAPLPEPARVDPPEPLQAEELFLLERETLIQASAYKRIVIADEPLAHLSVERGAALLALLRSQAEAGKTVLVASRNPLLVSRADRLITIGDKLS